MLLMKPEKIRVNDAMCELKIHGSSTFRFQAYKNETGEPGIQGEGWHWHQEAEFICVLEGKFQCGINGEYLELSEGEALFINSGTLHMSGAFPENFGENALSLVFAPEFLAEDKQGLLYRKYIEPVAGDLDFKGCVLRQEEGGGRILEALKQVCEICRGKEEWMSQLEVRNELSRAWGFLAEYKRHKKGTYVESSGNQIQEQRVKEIITYMQTHYAEPVTVEKISKSVNLSRTECFRCFHSIMGISPMEYLNNFRMRQAAFKLKNTDFTVTEICISSGFSHPSYFGKKFREVYGVSPGEYRKF